MRAVLEYLGRHGDSAVPRIAEARRVSRQHVQVIVNDLVAAGLAEFRDNPSHRRSRLVAATPAGRGSLAAMMAIEHELFAAVTASVDRADLIGARETLSAVRLRLEAQTEVLEQS